MFAMHCDRAECLTEASRGSITEEADQTNSTDYTDGERITQNGNKEHKRQTWLFGRDDKRRGGDVWAIPAVSGKGCFDSNVTTVESPRINLQEVWLCFLNSAG